MNFTKRLLILTIVCLIPLTGFSQVKAKKLSLVEFINLSLKNNPRIAKIEQDYKSQKYSLKTIEALKDLVLSVSPSFTYTDPLSSNGTVIGNDYKIFSLSASLSKKFPELLGMSGQVGLDYSKSSYTGTGGTTSISPSISLSLTIPLLSNFLGKADQMLLKNASINQQVLKFAKQESYESYIAELHKSYRNWKLLHIKKILYRGFRNRAATLLSQTSKKRRVGLADAADVHLARQNWLRYKALYEQTGIELISKEKDILTSITGKPIDGMSTLDYAPSEIFKLQKTEFTNIDLTKIRSIVMAKLQLASSKNDYLKAKSESKPDLNFMLSAKKGGTGTDISSALSPLDENQLYAGFEFSFPLQNSQKKYTLKSKDAGLKKSQNVYADTLNAISMSLQQLENTVKKQITIVKLYKSIENTSRYRVAATLKKYRQGRTTLQAVADAHNSYSDARINYLVLLVTVNNFYVDYLSLTDRLYVDFEKKIAGK
jgi:outer membrane protein